EATIELAVEAAARAVSPAPWSEHDPIRLDAQKFSRLPDEVALRLLGRAIRWAGEGPVQLGKLETLCEAIAQTQARPQTARFRRTLAGALVTLAANRLTIERAPARNPRNNRRSATLTTRALGHRAAPKRR